MNSEKENNHQIELSKNRLVIAYILLELIEDILLGIIGITNPYLGLSLKISLAILHLAREHKK